MKKTIAVIISLCMLMIMCLPVLAETTTPTSEDVMSEYEATAAYLINGKTDFTVDDATNIYYLTQQCPDAFTDEMAENFLNDVKQNLEANGNAKITKSDDSESMATYAAIVYIADMYFDDGSTDFYGVDLNQLLANCDPSTITNPYDCTIILPVLSWVDEDLTKTIIDNYIATYYTMGQGVDYYGFSCDSTCMFVEAVANSIWAEDYKEVLADAITVIDSYKTDGGYGYSVDYPDANADSTGLALMAKSTYAMANDVVDGENTVTDEELEELTAIYNDLLAFKGATEGSYTYGGAESAYATSDALKGLNEYWWVLRVYEIEHTVWDDPDDTDGAGDTDDNSGAGNADDANAIDDNAATEDIATNDVPATGTNEKSYFPNTGDMSSVIVLGVAALGVCGLIVSRKKED